MKFSDVLNVDLIVRNQISCDINGKIMQISTILIAVSDYSSAVVGDGIFIFRCKSIHVDELSVSCVYNVKYTSSVCVDGMCNKHSSVHIKMMWLAAMVWQTGSYSSQHSLRYDGNHHLEMPFRSIKPKWLNCFKFIFYRTLMKLSAKFHLAKTHFRVIFSSLWPIARACVCVCVPEKKEAEQEFANSA